MKRLDVCLFRRSLAAARLLLSAQRIGDGRRRLAANASSVMLSPDERGLTQICCYCRTVYFLHLNSALENSLHFNLADTESKYFIIKIPVVLLDVLYQYLTCHEQ